MKWIQYKMFLLRCSCAVVLERVLYSTLDGMHIIRFRNEKEMLRKMKQENSIFVGYSACIS